MRANKSNIILFLKELKQEILRDGICKIGLFGSFARDEDNIYSDIDIAIQKDDDYLEKYNAYDYFRQISKIKTILRDKFSRNSDVFDIDSNSSMIDTIKKDIVYV